MRARSMPVVTQAASIQMGTWGRGWAAVGVTLVVAAGGVGRSGRLEASTASVVMVPLLTWG